MSAINSSVSNPILYQQITPASAQPKPGTAQVATPRPPATATSTAGTSDPDHDGDPKKGIDVTG